jgi:hypothetical protein
VILGYRELSSMLGLRAPTVNENLNLNLNADAQSAQDARNAHQQLLQDPRAVEKMCELSEILRGYVPQKKQPKALPVIIESTNGCPKSVNGQASGHTHTNSPGAYAEGDQTASPLVADSRLIVPRSLLLPRLMLENSQRRDHFHSCQAAF